MARLSSPNPKQLRDFIERSQDGYAVFNHEDVLTYCNSPFAELFCYGQEDAIGKRFADLLRHAHSLQQGVRLDQKAIEDFIESAHQLRRSRAFRIFEVDMIDGRWFLFSEQCNELGEMLVQAKDITKQKTLEHSLQNSIVELNRLALTDELTKVANRRSFVSSVDSELSRCRRTGTSMTMALLDLDHFKAINDTYGHQAGDAALQYVAQLIRNSLRQYDILGRIGGEEFAIFLSNTDQETASKIADRTRQEIFQHPLQFEGSYIQLSASIGMATHGCNATFNELYTEADGALYKAKSGGRNRVVIATGVI
ncbi:GGDEF domain-containing protein [Hahella sp. CCB-MM4]|uniref:GGDEF domain-containing protein n=1 Tax=Hahella sp. (strain CCB-MM4) TaxID=1926491 RepID=UPI000B9C3C45|nr:sensor domain-containing diguanylate cyclase [Hahella sp. CCB-MM4]OZG70701.1 GGDEF domain-containing protein [Hahella sp. CCB-MM4]